MSEFFLSVVNMSISAGWLVLAVVLLRFLFKKAPKWVAVLLWGIVAIRLVCPFSIESVMSLVPSGQTITPEIMTDNIPAINSGIPVINSVVNPVISESFAPAPSDSANPLQILVPIIAVVWIFGIVVMLSYTIISYFNIKRKIGTAVLLRENIFQSESVVSPFVLGIIKPRIYLPFSMQDRDMEYVIAHEKAHISRRDYLWKPIGFLILTIHWFNPLVWLSYALLCRDIELACDEKVVKDLDKERKADYSEALLNCSINRRMIAACPLAFGEVGVKNRIKSVLNYKKPAFWIITVSIITSVTVAVCFLTNPKTEKWQSENYTIFCNAISAECDNVVYEYKYGTLNKDYPYICVNWTNNTNDTLCFGEDFVIYKGDEIYNPKGQLAFDSIMHFVKPGKNKSENYDLSAYKLEKGRIYRLEKTFHLESEPNKKYTAFISFSVDTTFSFVGKQYACEKIVYDNGSFSLVLKEDNVPNFRISEQYLNIYKTDENRNNEWKTIDGLQQIKLEKSNFDDLFTSEIWEDGLSARKIRKENLNAFSSFDLNGTKYYLLEQKNGEIYIAQSNGSTSDFRWLYKMKEVEKTGSSELSSVDELKEKYPEFFGVSTDGGLTVYVWEVAKEDYRCYLVNTFTEALVDRNFAFEVGATIEEMKTILATYDIDKKDITVQGVNNPLSNYNYVIDSAYHDKVEALILGDKTHTETQDDNTSERQDSTESKKENTVGVSVPELNVVCGSEKAKAVMGTSSWTNKTSDGKMQTVNADGAHPLDRMEYLLPLALKVKREENTKSYVNLDFNLKPDRLTVNSWFLTKSGKKKAFDSKIEGFEILLNEGEETCVYEIVAIWDKSDEYYGTVRYSFCVEQSVKTAVSKKEEDTESKKEDTSSKNENETDFKKEDSTESESDKDKEDDENYDTVINNNPFKTTFTTVSWVYPSAIFDNALNYNKRYTGNIEHTPIFKIDTLDELEQFKNMYNNAENLPFDFDLLPEFSEATRKYDNSFFEENSLIVVYVSASSGSFKYEIRNVEYDQKTFCVHVTNVTKGDLFTADMKGWLVSLEVSDGLIARNTEFDAVMDYKPIFTPYLDVVCDGQVTRADSFTVEWAYEDWTGEMREGGMSGADPLKNIEAIKSLEIDTSNQIQSIAKLNFNIAPNKLEVNSWVVDKKGKKKSFDSKIENYRIKLKNSKEKCIYELVATWNDSKKYYGIEKFYFAVN